LETNPIGQPVVGQLPEKQPASIWQPVAAKLQLSANQLVGIVQSVIAQFSSPPEKLMESLLNHPNGIKDKGTKSNSVEDGKSKGE
jgi:hypothetical protein